jgi:zinc/manganese transport system substrate-binding protein
MIRIALPLLGLALALPARALEVVTTTEGLASIAREVAGDDAHVESLSRGSQDPHFVDANPVLAVKLRRADLLVDVGIELEAGWLPPLVNQARNGSIQPGGKGRLTVAGVVQVLEAPTGPVDRSMGDLHPGGNPHFLSDPRRVEAIAVGIVGKLAELDPKNAAKYQARLADFRRRLGEARARWEAQLARVRGQPVVTHHRTLSYFTDWAGLRRVGELEPKPGTPPPPSHIADLVGVVKAQGVRAILVESYYDLRPAETLARFSGAKVVVIPGDVGGDPAAKDWFSYEDLVVRRVVEAIVR